MRRNSCWLLAVILSPLSVAGYWQNPAYLNSMSMGLSEALEKCYFLHTGRMQGNSPIVYAAVAAKPLQSCPTLCDPIDGSPPGSAIPEILQARTLEWVAMSFFNAWKWKVKVKSLSRVRLLATAWTAAYQAPLSVGFSRQEYWSGVPLPSPEFIIYETLNSSFHWFCW